MRVYSCQNLMTLRSEVHEFFVEGHNKHLSHVLLHIATPTKPENEHDGYFFVIIEIDRPTQDLLTYIEDIITEGESIYYDKSNTIEGYTHFESIIELLNRKARPLLQDDAGKRIHMIVGSLIGHQLAFAYRGDALALLAYEDKDGTSFTSIAEDTLYPDNVFFSSVIEGSTRHDESLCITTPHLGKYFSYDRIAKMIIHKSAKDASRHIHKALEGIASEYSFGGIVINTVRTTEKSIPPRAPHKKNNIGSHESIERLLDTTKNTEETLSPKIFSKITETLKSTHNKDKIKNKEQEYLKSGYQQKAKKGQNLKRGKTKYTPTDENTRSALVITGKIIFAIIQTIYTALRMTIIGFATLCTTLWFLITNHKGKRTILIDQYSTIIKARLSRFKELGIVGKILILILFVGVIVFVASVTYTRSKEKVVAQEAEYEISLEEIQEKYQEAEAYILYGETQKAIESIENARQLLDSLSHNTDEKIQRAEKMHQDFEDMVYKLQKMTKVVPEVITNINETQPQAMVDSIALLENKILAVGKNDQSLYLITEATGTIETRSVETARQLTSPLSIREGTQAVLVSEQRNIITYESFTGNILSRTIGYPHELVTLADIAIYNNRLYTLDTNNGAIYRHEPTQLGYDRGVSWVKTQSNASVLQNGTSITIDGSVYVATDTGTILKFFAGDELVFNVTDVNPPITSPTQIETDFNLRNLYVLEPKNKRVVVLDKNGKFLKQFTADEWTKPSYMIISPNERYAYILDQNIIYRFRL